MTGPAPKGGHRRRDLAEVGLDNALQRIDSALLPLFEVRRRQPAQTEQHVDGADEALFGKRRLSYLADPLLHILTCHGWAQS